MSDKERTDSQANHIKITTVDREISISQEDSEKLRNIEKMTSEEIAAMFKNEIEFAQTLGNTIFPVANNAASNKAETAPQAQGGVGGGEGSPKEGEGETTTIFLDHNRGPADMPTMSHDELKNSFKSARKSDGNYRFVPPSITPERLQRMNKPVEFVGKSLTIFHKATIQYIGREIVQNFKGEKEYLMLYEDMKQNEKDWFIFLEDEQQFVWVEWGTGMINTLATIYRQRGCDAEGRTISPENNAKCHQVLAVSEKLLARYREMIYNYAENRIPEYINKYEELYFKDCRIRLNLWSQELVHDDTMVPIIRKAMEYELKNGTDEFTFMLSFIGKKETLADLEKTSDAEINKMAKLFINFVKSKKPEVKQKKTTKELDAFNKMIADQRAVTSLSQCALCAKIEPFLNTYKRCSQCRLVKYCSSECQKQHWKVHKPNCNK